MERMITALYLAIWASDGIKVAVYAFTSDWAGFINNAGWMLLFAYFLHQRRQVE